MVPSEFLAPYLLANALALAALAIAFWRRGAVRWAAAVLFAWAAITNTRTVLGDPGAYLEYAALTPSEWYRAFITGWFSRHIEVSVLEIAGGQVAIAVLLASPRHAHRWTGALGAWVFLLAIAPLGVGSAFPFSLTFGAALLVALGPAAEVSPRLRAVVHWTPRVVGLAFAVFLLLFAFDVSVAGLSVIEGIRRIALHAVPSFGVAVVIAVAWRWPWVGGVLCFGLAVIYGAYANGRFGWMLAISAPLVIVGALFLWSWRIERERIAVRTLRTHGP
jgi:hypothetical protein